MKQVLEMTGLQSCGEAPRSRLLRVLDRLFLGRTHDRLVRPELLSDHVARDIGLGADVPGNPLLRDGWLRR
jgi:hypothetical protein